MSQPSAPSPQSLYFPRKSLPRAAGFNPSADGRKRRADGEVNHREKNQKFAPPSQELALYHHIVRDTHQIKQADDDEKRRIHEKRDEHAHQRRDDNPQRLWQGDV